MSSSQDGNVQFVLSSVDSIARPYKSIEYAGSSQSNYNQLYVDNIVSGCTIWYIPYSHEETCVLGENLKVLFPY